MSDTFFHIISSLYLLIAMHLSSVVFFIIKASSFSGSP